MALLEPGDEVIYPNPGFPIYESMINFLGAKPVPIPLVEDRGFSFDLNVLKDSLSPKTKMLILNSPHNPTGGVIPAADVRAIADMVRDRDLMILSDEIYTRIYFDEEPLSITTLPGMLEKTIILDGFSKTYAMTGWRMGYGVMPTWLVDPVNKLMVNSNSCTASFTQRAGIAALNGPQDDVTKMVAEFRRRRDAFCAGLNTLPGFRCAIPGGAFYAFPNITGTGWKSKELADALLQKAGVACLSGTAFGAYGDGYLRFSIANSYEKLMDAVERIRKFLQVSHDSCTDVTTAECKATDLVRQFTMKNPTRRLRIGSRTTHALECQATCLGAITADDRVHLVFQLELHFLQPVFLHLFLGGEVRLGFESFQLLMKSGMLLGQLPELLVGLHQVRLQFFLRVLHQGSISFVRLPRRVGRIDLLGG